MSSTGRSKTETVASRLVPAAAGVAYGVGIERVHRELFLTASGWWGAGNTSIGLLFHGVLEIVRLHAAAEWWPTLPAAAGLYGLQATLLHQARRGPRRRTAAASVYGSWTAAAIAAAGWHRSRLGYARFYEVEAGGWAGLTRHAPA